MGRDPGITSVRKGSSFACDAGELTKAMNYSVTSVRTLERHQKTLEFQDGKTLCGLMIDGLHKNVVRLIL